MGFRTPIFAACLGYAVAGGAAAWSVAAPDRAPALFSSYDVLKLTLEAPFDDLFARAKEDPEATVNGTVTIGDTTIKDVAVSTRGHTSMEPNECSFPKLKLRFASPPESPFFAGLKAVKIGTHCGDRPDDQLTPKYGRLANARSPHREAFVYRLLSVIGVPTLKARPAEITYISPGRDGGAAPLVRNAFLLEDDGEAMKRLGAMSQIEPPDFESASAVFSAGETAKLAFAEAMIGNFDWCLKFTADDRYRCDARKILWNVFAFRKADGTAIPLMYDFDIAGMVVGKHDWFPKVYNGSFVTSKSHREIEVLSQVQRTRSLFPRAVLDATRRSFVDRKDAAFREVDQSTIDEEGKRQVREYLTAFFAAIELDEAFYLPVVVKEGTQAFSDPAGEQPVCGSASSIPIGTPVSRALNRNGDMVQVSLLDALWRWATPVKCDGVKNGPVWVAERAVGTKYPN